MPEKKPATYAVGTKQIAKALGLPLTPRKEKGSLFQVNQWLKQDDFPKKHTVNGRAVGRKIAELQEWLRQKSVISNQKSEGGDAEARGDARPTEVELFTRPEQLRNRRLHLLDIFLNPTKYPNASGGYLRLTKMEYDELHAAGLIPAESAPDAEALETPAVAAAGATLRTPEGVEVRVWHDRQSTLADALQMFWGKRIQYVITPQILSKWIIGPRDHGVPPPPSKSPRQFNLNQWNEWFERWLLPTWRHSVDGQANLLPNLHRESVDAEARTKIHREVEARIARENAEREHDVKWLRMSEQLRAVQVGTIGLRLAARAANERRDVEQLRAQCREWNLPGDLTARLAGWVLQRGIERQTELELAIQKWGADLTNGQLEPPAALVLDAQGWVAGIGEGI